MKSIIDRIFSIKALLSLLLVFAASGAWADFAKTNPVTGETENYTWKFVGTDTWNGTGNWQDSSEANPSGTPAKSGDNTWDPILFDGNTININASMSVEGWNLRMGLYNGANVTMNTFVKYQGDTTMWMTVDETSQLTIGGFGGGNITDGQVIKLSVARANGITWNVDLTSVNANNTFEYYLKGAGSVSYQAVSAASHKIKMADVTLTGTSQVSSKTLVSFTSSTPTFTADATIKVKNSSGDVVKNVSLGEVNTTGATTLTTDNAVGSCELVQTSSGIVLYYVDGDPSDVTTYKPSININFTNDAGNGLTTSADVGLEGYAVPGTSWNNFVVANNTTYNTVNAIDSTGAASVASGVSVTVSGTRGHWNCSNLTPASNLLHGYIDESAALSTPTVTITGIPYEHYRVIVYHSTDQNGAQFGYDTINGFNFTYVDGVQETGTTSWGNAGSSNSAEPIEEGVNTLVSAVLSGDTVTMVAHRIGGGSPTARGCFAAIQVVEYVPEAGENDLEIAVDGATEYEVTETKELSGTVYLTGSGTLTLSGSEKITAATIDVAKDVVLNVNADRLDATTFTGAGTVVYNGSAPVTGKGWTAIGWSGTVWVKNQAVANFNTSQYGNAGSVIRFTGVTGYFGRKTTDGVTHTVPVELLDDGDTKAFTYNNGWGGSVVVINTLRGTGTLVTGTAGNGEIIYIANADDFSGNFSLAYKKVQIGGSEPSGNNQSYNGQIAVAGSATVSSASTWTANGGFVVSGTLNVNGTLASSAANAITGSGTVVFNNRLPTPTGDAWWKNADWTGAVQIKGVTNLVGASNASGTYIDFNQYGHDGSIVELNNVTGWINYNYTCVPKLKVTGTLYLNNGYSGAANAFKVGTLLGSGTISGDGSADTVVFNVTEDASGFTGAFGLNNKCIVFGSTIPDTLTAGTIYVTEGAVATMQQASGTWWAVGGIKVDGTLKATGRDKWGGGTAVTLGDTGVLELTSTANAEDYSDYSTVTGTGTIKYSSTAGWRTFPSDDAKMPATTLTVQVELADSLIITKNNNGTTTIGNLAGTKNIRSDWSATSGGADARTLAVTQSKDTEWSGKFVSNRITQFNVGGTGGTLTLSGTQDVTIPATISGAVNLTGTWVGATTVSGTFGGTGTLTGDLTFSDGATFKAGASELTVDGTVTTPGSGSVTVDVSGVGEITDSGVTLISGGVSDVGTFAVDSAYRLAAESGALKVYPTYVAEYNGVQYETFAEAIAAVIEAEGDIADIIVLDDTAELPAGYVISEGTVVVAKAKAVNDSTSSTVYFASLQGAVDAAVSDNTGSTYVVALADGTATASVNSIYFKPNGFDATIAPTAAGYAYVQGQELSPVEAGLYVYTSNPAAATFTWNGGASGDWTVAANWTSDDGVVTAYPNNALYTIVFDSNAAVALNSNISAYEIDVGGVVSITAPENADPTITAATGGIVLTDAAATLTVTGVTLSPTPTVGELSYLETSISEGTTTYTCVTYGHMDGTTAVVTDTTEAIPLPADATAITVEPNSGVTTFTGVTEENFSKLFGVTFMSGSYNITAAMVDATKIGQDSTGKYLINNGDGTYTVKFMLDDAKSVTVDGETIAVKPEVKTDDAAVPMEIDSTSDKAKFTVKSIPGLYYAVTAGTTLDAYGNPAGTVTHGQAVQATSASTSPVAPDFTGTVQYYKISVGATADEPEE